MYLQAYNDSGCVGHTLFQTEYLFEDKLKQNKKELKK